MTARPRWLGRLREASTIAFVAMLIATPAFAASDDFDDQDVRLGILVITLLGSAYIVPTIIAFARDHPKRWQITVVNLLLGWTAIGWVWGVVWALSTEWQTATGDAHSQPEATRPAGPQLGTKTLSAATQTDFEAITVRLQRLKQLREDGSLTDVEYGDLRRPLIQALSRTQGQLPGDRS